MDEFYSLKYDSVFKNVFFMDYRLLKKLLVNIFKVCDLNTRVENIQIRNCELTKDRVYIKNKVVDILIETDDKIINFEVNTKWDIVTMRRNFLYAAAIVGALIKKNQSYKQLKEFIQININYNNHAKKGTYVYELYDIHSKKLFIKNFKIIEVNIDKIMDEWYNTNEKDKYYEENKYILTMGMSKEELENIKGDDKYMRKIRDDVFRINEDEEFFQVLTDEEDEEKWRMTYFENGEEKGKKEGIKEGIKAGKKEGRKEGIKKEKLSNAKKMKLKNIPLNIIKEITGLDMNTIKSL